MLAHSIRNSFNLIDLRFQIILGCSLGLFVGSVFRFMPPLIVFGLLIAAVFAGIAFRRPEIALLGILIATSSIVFEEKLPLISFGISLHIPDILFLGLLGIVAVRWLVEPKFKIIHTPLDWPLLIFFGVTILSTVIAVAHSTVEIEEARRSLRTMSYYLTFFIVTNLVRERRQINSLLNGLFLLATIVAAAMVAQFFLGSAVNILSGRVENLKTQHDIFNDITRILPPGWSIVLVSFVAIFCILVLEKNKPIRFLNILQCGLLGIAFLFTFLRSYSVALIIMFFLLGHILRGADRRRLIRWGLMIIFSAAMILLVLSNDPGSRSARLIGASISRLSTLVKSGEYQGQDSSLNWRMIENEYALSSIPTHPFIGLGMGARYRPWDSRLDRDLASGYDFRKHIHNGHLWILLDTGMVGYLAFMWLSFAFLIRGFRYWQCIANDRMRGVVLGFALVYVAILIASVANSTFVQPYWTPVIGTIMGINEVILKKYRAE